MCCKNFVIITFLVLLSSQSYNGLEIEKTSILRELIALLDELIRILKEFISIVDDEVVDEFELTSTDTEIYRLPDNSSIKLATSKSTDHLYEAIPTLSSDVYTHATTDILSEPIAPDKTDNTAAETTYENPTLIRGSEIDDKSKTLNFTLNNSNVSVLKNYSENVNNLTKLISDKATTVLEKTDINNSTLEHPTKVEHTEVYETKLENVESISSKTILTENTKEDEDKSNDTLILKRIRRKLPTTLEKSLNDLEFLFDRKLISEETVQLLKNCVQYLGDLLMQYNSEQNSTLLEALNNTDLKQLLREAVLMQKRLQQIQALVDDANSFTVSNQRYIILCGLFLALGILILLLMLCLLFMNKKIQRLVNRISGRDRSSSDYWTMGTATTNSLNDTAAAQNNTRQSVWEEPPFLSHYIGSNYRPNPENNSTVNDSRWINPLSDHNYFWKRSREWSGREWNYNRKNNERVPKFPPQDYYVPSVSGALQRYDPVTLCPLRSN